MHSTKKRLLTQREKENWFKYKKPGNNPVARLPVNHFHYSMGNSIPHEQEKLGVLMKLRLVGHQLITEAVECAKPNLRRDVVDLSTGVIYEIETNKKRALRHKDNKNVEVRIVEDENKTGKDK